MTDLEKSDEKLEKVNRTKTAVMMLGAALFVLFGWFSVTLLVGMIVATSMAFCLAGFVLLLLGITEHGIEELEIRLMQEEK